MAFGEPLLDTGSAVPRLFHTGERVADRISGELHALVHLHVERIAAGAGDALDGLPGHHGLGVKSRTRRLEGRQSVEPVQLLLRVCLVRAAGCRGCGRCSIVRRSAAADRPDRHGQQADHQHGRQCLRSACFSVPVPLFEATSAMITGYVIPGRTRFRWLDGPPSVPVQHGAEEPEHGGQAQWPGGCY